jgi:hypothetical protein
MKNDAVAETIGIIAEKMQALVIPMRFIAYI